MKTKATIETLEEIEDSVLLHTKMALDRYLELPMQHPLNGSEFLFHIHALQHFVLAGRAIRWADDGDPRRQWKRR